MKRLPFWLLAIATAVVSQAVDTSITNPTTGLYYETDVMTGVVTSIAAISVYFYIFKERARDAGLKSAWHGLWCFVPFAVLWFGCVPTGYHKKDEEGHEPGSREA